MILGTGYHVLLWHAGTLRLCSYHTHQQFVFTMVKSMVATIPVGIDVRAPPKWRGIPHNNVFSHYIRKNNYELKHVVSLNLSSITSHVTFTSQPFTYPRFPDPEDVPSGPQTSKMRPKVRLNWVKHHDFYVVVTIIVYLFIPCRSWKSPTFLEDAFSW